MLSRAPIPNLSEITAQTNFGDSIAHICWHPQRPSSLLAVSSWDEKIRLYSVTGSYPFQDLQEQAEFNTEYPCLALCFMDGSNLAVGSIDGSVKVIDYSSRESVYVLIGKHEDAVKGVYFFHGKDGNRYLLSVSYDQTLKVWDLRQQYVATTTIQLGAKAVCSDVSFPMMILGLSNQKFHVFNILEDVPAGTVGPERDTTLGSDQPISSVSIAKDLAIGIGSLSGRSALSWLDARLQMNRTFCFRAQQITAGQPGNRTDKPILFPVNAVGLHPENTKTYFTTGKDGVIHFWDTEKRRRIVKFETGGVPVTEAKWSPDGKFLIYGCGYDWSIGIEGAKSFKTTLKLHTVQPSELATQEIKK